MAKKAAKRAGLEEQVKAKYTKARSSPGALPSHSAGPAVLQAAPAQSRLPSPLPLVCQVAELFEELRVASVPLGDRSRLRKVARGGVWGGGMVALQ